MGNEQTTPMSLDRLKVEHPDVYRAALNAGIQQERTRAVQMAASWAGNDRAFKLLADCLRDGDEIEAALRRRTEQLQGQVGNAREALLIRDATDEQLKEHFEKTKALQDEFSGFDAYRAYVDAERRGAARTVCG